MRKLMFSPVPLSEARALEIAWPSHSKLFHRMLSQWPPPPKTFTAGIWLAVMPLTALELSVFEYERSQLNFSASEDRALSSRSARRKYFRVAGDPTLLKASRTYEVT